MMSIKQNYDIGYFIKHYLSGEDINIPVAPSWDWLVSAMRYLAHMSRGKKAKILFARADHIEQDDIILLEGYSENKAREMTPFDYEKAKEETK